MRTLAALLLLAMLIGSTFPATPLAHAQNRDSVFGVNSHTASRFPDFALMNRATAAVAASGAGWVREDFQWNRIEPAQGQYDWGFHDRMLELYRAESIQVLGVLNGPTPGWANGRGSADFSAPNPDQYASFVRQVVTRYQDRVSHWQVWNEPDNARYWAPTPNLPAYAQLLITTAQVIRAVDPSATILVAGMVTPQPAGDALRVIAEQGAWDAFDVIAVHPYTDPFAPEVGGIDRSLAAVTAVRDTYGYKPMWATEFGWATSQGRDGSAFTPDAQANYLIRGATLLRAAGVERIFWYNLKDNGPVEAYGLIDTGGGATDYAPRKPSFTAFTTLNQQLAGTTSAQRITTGNERIVDGFEPLGNWTRGDQPNGTLTATTERIQGGTAAARLDYTFATGGNDFVVFLRDTPLALPVGTSQLGLWVYGNGSGHEVKVWLEDSQGELLQYRLGLVGGNEWSLLTAPLGAPVERFNIINNPVNGVLDQPATLRALVLDDYPDPRQDSGTIFLDQLTATVGPDAYVVRFARPDGNAVDVAWATSDGGSVPINTQSDPVAAVDRNGTPQGILVTNGTMTVTTGNAPLFITHTPGLVAPVAAPPPPDAPPPPPPGEQPLPPDARCFPETGFCMYGRIREYWEQNGGLPVFGYPIAPQTSAVIEGQTLQVQWFERNRMELHPTNPPPYDVLLGRLGVDRLDAQQRDWTQFARAGQPQPDCRYFEATQQNVCGEFLAAWRANGLDLDQNGISGENDRESLALFGQPLSAPISEQLPDGNTYTVQWFERARFELHPENDPPFRVLFGLLGNEMQATP